MGTHKIYAESFYMTNGHKKKILDIATAAGYEVCFIDDMVAQKEKLKDAEIIFACAAPYGDILAKEAENLSWYCSLSAGVKPVLKKGILPDSCLVTNSAGAYGVSIAEHMIMVTLMLLRRYPEFYDSISRKEWVNNLPLNSIYGKNIAVLGAGDIGINFAKRARAFCPASITGVSYSGKEREKGVFDKVISYDHLDEIISCTDIFEMCMPGTDSTANLMSEERLSRVKPTSYLINVGRGMSIDQKALVRLLNEGKIAGAALDVMAVEPIPQDDPLWNAKNIILTPHCSGKMTVEFTRDKCVEMFCEDLDNYLNGRELVHLIDKTKGY